MIFFSVVSFAQTSFLLPQKSSCFQISLWTLFWKYVFGFSPKRPFKSSSFSFRRELKCFSKILLENFVQFFLFCSFFCSACSHVCSFFFKKRWKTAYQISDNWTYTDFTRSTTSPHETVCSRELSITPTQSSTHEKKVVLLGTKKGDLFFKFSER